MPRLGSSTIFFACNYLLFQNHSTRRIFNDFTKLILKFKTTECLTGQVAFSLTDPSRRRTIEFILVRRVWSIFSGRKVLYCAVYVFLNAQPSLWLCIQSLQCLERKPLKMSRKPKQRDDEVQQKQTRIAIINPDKECYRNSVKFNEGLVLKASLFRALTSRSSFYVISFEFKSGSNYVVWIKRAKHSDKKGKLVELNE